MMKFNIIFSSVNVCVSHILDVNCCTFLRFYGSSRTRNPYDVLGIKSTCSTKDVKKAYIKLCKELHPDKKPGDVSQHKKFIELNDAYTALLNSDDKKKNVSKNTSSNRDVFWKTPNYSESHSQTDWNSEKKWYETEDYQKYYRQHNHENLMNKNYRKANSWVIAGCVILMIIGSVLYYTAYSYATRYTLASVDKKSKTISESYYGLRKSAADKGKSEQLDDFKRKWKV